MNESLIFILQDCTCIEFIVAIYLLCVFLIIANFSVIMNGMRCLIALTLATYGLVGGLIYLAYSNDWMNLILYWGIFGAIAQFSLAGVVFAGLSGFPFGCLFITLLGFILCPFIWIRLVLNVLLVSFGVNSKLSLIGIALALASYFGLIYAPSTSDIDHSITDLINQGGDNYHTNSNNDSGDQLRNIYNRNKDNRKPVAYALTVSGRDHREQTLVIGCNYTAKQLYPCCGNLTPPNGEDKTVFSLEPNVGKDSCTVRPGDSGFAVVSSPDQYDSSFVVKPGSVIFILNGKIKEQILFVESVSYLDENGTSYSKYPSIMYQIMRHGTPVGI